AQYMEYVELMKSLNLELAAEYLVMAALLGEIKSRMLLPRQPGEEEEELDPRAELIRRLQEYERYKKAAEDIEVMPRVGREIHLGAADPPEYERPKSHPDVDLREVLLALQEVLHRADMFESHQVTREKLSTRERMTQVLERLGNDRFLPFVSLFSYEEGRLGVVVTFLAILELVKESLIELVQNEPFGPIHVRTRASAHEVGEEILDDNADESSVDDAYEVRTPALDAFSADHEGIELSAETLLEDATGPFDPAVLNYVESAEEAALEEALLREARLNEAGFVEAHLVETGPAETGFDDPDQSIDPESSDPIRSDASDSSDEISEAARFEAEDSHSQRINRDPFASDTLSSHTVTNDATETAETEESDDVTR
ncbi:MAG TPA: ScpA family protein, partial [Dongiaceae bacterium]|nr:ScpA family protein [Dongiaceae bacterium]